MSGLLLMGGSVAPPPFQPCPRTFSGNMCGIYVPQLPAVPGGATNPDLVLSWFLDRYEANQQARIRAGWSARAFTDALVSWPDSRAMGATPESFANFCVGLKPNFEPAVMLLSKNYDTGGTLQSMKDAVAPLIPHLVKRVGRICVGWELDLIEPFASDPIQLQYFIDWLAPQIVPWGGRLYVHFSPGYFAWQPDGEFTEAFWNANIGKLTGILHQKVLEWDMAMYQARIVDCLERFAGRDGFSPDSGFGHPWDFIALEITATFAFNDNMSEADQNAWAADACSTPGVIGPEGLVSVMGAGNGIGVPAHFVTPLSRAVYDIGMHPMLGGLALPSHPNM